MKTDSLAAPDYARFVAELKDRIRSARIAATRAINRELVLLYWDIGRAIIETQKRHGWGDSIVQQLARDLRAAFPEMLGFSADNLWRIRQFHVEYSQPRFLEQLVPEARKQPGRFLEQTVPATPAAPDAGRMDATRPAREQGPLLRTELRQPDLTRLVQELLGPVPWGHHVEIIKKVKVPAARIYYLRATGRFGWSRNVLLNQIKAQAYERAKAERKSHNFPVALPEHLAEQADEMLKSSYNLEFLGIGRAVKERELETRLIDRLRDFILELGYGFCFVGRQHRLVLGRKEYFVDLLFYHRFLKALVAIDLKVGPFEPEFAGKMDFYLNVLNEKERAPDDRPSIGIILCAEKDNLEVEFALKTKTNPIGVAEYQLQPRLPAEFRGKLPTPQQFTDAMRAILPGAAATSP